MKAWLQSILLFRDDKQQVVTNGYPYLGVDCISGCSIESLNMQMLFDPFEENLNLPSLPVKFRNGNRVNSKLVCKKAVDFAIPEVLVHNEPEIVWILTGSVISGEPDSLVGDKSSLMVDLPGLDNLKQHVVLGSCDKPSVIQMEMIVEGVKLHIPFIHQIIGIFLNRNFIHDFGIVDRSLRKAYESRNRASQIHESVHLDSAFPVMKFSPWAQCKTQFNRTAVKCTHHFFKVHSKLLAFVKFLCLLYQDIAKVLVDTPILLLVRFGKRGFGHNLQSGTVQIMRAQIESRFNVPQSSPVSELGKAHHKKLVPAIELDGMSVASVALDTLAEFIFRNERHKLREDCFSFIHCLREMSLWSSCKLTCSNRKIILLLYLAII